MDLEVYPGQEVFLSPEIPELLDEGRLVTLFDGGKYLLVELPMMSIPQYALHIIHSIHLRGVRVILAHPERNREIAADINKLHDIVRIGALVQVNSLSLMGVFGSNSQRAGEKIMRAGLAHIIATDCHTARSRAPRMKKALAALNDKTASIFTEENPRLIMEGKAIEVPFGGYKSGRFGIVKKLALFFSSFRVVGEKEV
nr:CpsB/CapC family capsule biosynthesis tyrosine phosphatase [Thermosediminibacter litoriperuensis]